MSTKDLPNPPEYDRNEIERKRLQMEQELAKSSSLRIKDKFGMSVSDKLEQEFKNNTVGLVTREEFVSRRENIKNIMTEDIKRKEEEKVKKKEKDRQDRLKQRKV